MLATKSQVDTCSMDPSFYHFLAVSRFYTAVWRFPNLPANLSSIILMLFHLSIALLQPVQTIPRFWWPKRDQISELAQTLMAADVPVVSTPLCTKGQEYKDQIHNIFVKQGITDGIKTGVLMLMSRRYKACKLVLRILRCHH